MKFFINKISDSFVLTQPDFKTLNHSLPLIGVVKLGRDTLIHPGQLATGSNFLGRLLSYVDRNICFVLLVYACYYCLLIIVKFCCCTYILTYMILNWKQESASVLFFSGMECFYRMLLVLFLFYSTKLFLVLFFGFYLVLHCSCCIILSMVTGTSVYVVRMFDI